MALALSRTRSLQLRHHREFTTSTANNNNNDEKNSILIEEKRVMVPVVYYLSRNGKLEHPHFVEVPLSSPQQGLFLRDVVSRLNLLRGKSMANCYSWSSKRSYKNGYVWHDLEENDYIHPVHGGEYVLKGSELPEPKLLALPPPSSTVKNNIIPLSKNLQRKQSTDLHEYKVYKSAEFSNELVAADASTQTDDKRHHKKVVIKEGEIQEEQCSMELSNEISPLSSDSSPETLQTMLNSDGRSIASVNTATSSQIVDQATIDHRTVSGRMKASSVLLSLISCGSSSFKDYGTTTVCKDHGLSLVSHYKSRLPNSTDGMEKNVSSRFAKMALEDKEYFSGSLIENNKNNYESDHQFISLKRSFSYHADI